MTSTLGKKSKKGLINKTILSNNQQMKLNNKFYENSRAKTN